MEPAEFLDTLTGLIEQNYVVSNKVGLHTIEDVERAAFSVNAAYAQDLRDARIPAESANGNATSASAAAKKGWPGFSKTLRLAVAGGDLQRLSYRGLLSTFRPGPALLDRSAPSTRGGLVLRRTNSSARGFGICPSVCGRAAFFWTVFFWLRTVTVPGLVLVGAYMSIYFALWTWICGLLRPSLRAPLWSTVGRNRRLWRASRLRADRPGCVPQTTFASPFFSPRLGRPGNGCAAWSFLAGVGTLWDRPARAIGHHSNRGIYRVAGLSFLVAFTNVILLTTVPVHPETPG
jgi:hypothetical protein